MDQTATANWHGGLKDGKGDLSAKSSVLQKTPYSFSSRFENGKGTNPEELIAAAHAGCFTMALANELGQAGFTPDSLQTEATVSLDKADNGFAITKIALRTEAKVPGADEAAFRKAAETVKAGCPISKLFAGNAEITLDAKLLS